MRFDTLWFAFQRRATNALGNGSVRRSESSTTSYSAAGYVGDQMRSILLIVLSVQLLGCAGASEGKKRGWFDSVPRVSSCAADCQVWDDDKEVCLEYHEWTSQRCAELLTRGRR